MSCSDATPRATGASRDEMRSTQRLIPRSLRTSEAFLRDLGRFASLPIEVARDIIEALGSSFNPTMNEAVAEKLAERFQLEVDVVYRSAAVAALLASRARELGKSGSEVVSEIREALSEQETDSRMVENLAPLFVFTEEDRRDELARIAFASPPTFASSDPRPAFVPGKRDTGKFYKGFFWTISYWDSDNQARSITFGMSERELREVVSELDAALKQFDSVNFPVRHTPEA